MILASVLPVLTPWQEGDLDIHLIATGCGENTFVVMPDGTTMLIDAGMTKAPCLIKDKTPGQVLSDYMKHFSPQPDKLDYFFLTHFHRDHMGAVYDLGEQLRIDRIVDRAYPGYDNVNTVNAGEVGEYAAWVKSRTESKGGSAERFAVGSHSQFIPRKHDVKNFDIYNVAGGGLISTGNGLLARPFTPDDPNNFDENMMSCAVCFRYGPFTYYTGGDLPGCNSYFKRFKDGKAATPEIKANRKIQYRNFEAQVADLVGPVTAMKLHHHGVPDGTTAEFLWKMRPEVMLVSGGDHKQPCPTTLRRIADPQLPCAHKVYATSDRAVEGNGRKLWKATVAGVGHIVLRVSDGGRSYQVFVLDSGDQKYRVIAASEPRLVENAQRLAPDTHLPVSEDYGCIDDAADSVFRGVSSFSGTDEIHSMIILKDGKKIYERYDTGHRPDERHVMWSASKTFTAVAVGFAVQDSLLTVDDKVISFFRDDELPAERSRWLCDMTVKDLLTMSSGLGIDGIGAVRSLTWEHPAKEALSAPMAFEPGSRYKYNSMNTYLLSEIVQRCTGRKLSDYLTTKLFLPLGMCNWEWEESADGVTVGGWGLFTTTENLAKLGQFLLDKGKWNGRQLLSEEWIAAMARPYQYQGGNADAPDWRAGYGYQVWICTHNSFRVDGAKGQISLVIPEKNAVVTINGQLHSGKKNFMKMVWDTIYPKL